MNEYLVMLQRPMLKHLQRLQLIWSLIQILACGVGSVWLNLDLGDEVASFFVVSGEILLAAGLIPILLSLPLIMAKLTTVTTSRAEVGQGASNLRRLFSCPCFQDLNNGIAFGVCVCFVASGTL